MGNYHHNIDAPDRYFFLKSFGLAFPAQIRYIFTLYVKKFQIKQR
jgi:hypothetical protein